MFSIGLFYYRGLTMKTTKTNKDSMDNAHIKISNFLIDLYWQSVLRDSKNHNIETSERYFADAALAGRLNYNN